MYELGSEEHWAQEGRKLRAKQELFYDLLSDPEWIKRRVRTVQLIDDERFLHRVSLDIDLSDVRCRLENINKSLDLEKPSESELLELPLGILPKELLLDFSVVDRRRNPLSLMTSDKDTEIWQSMLLRIIEKDEYVSAVRFRRKYSDCLAEVMRAVGSDIIDIVGPVDSYRRLNLGKYGRRGFPSWLNEPIQPHIAKAIIRLETTYALQAAVVSLESKNDSWEQIGRRLLLDGNNEGCEKLWQMVRMDVARGTRAEIWRELFAIPLFVDYFKLAIGNFIPVVSINSSKKRYIVKYECQTPQTAGSTYKEIISDEIASRRERISMLRELANSGTRIDVKRRYRPALALLSRKFGIELLKGAGIYPARVEIDTSLATFASREHLKVICPKGVYISDCRYVSDERRPRDEFILTRVTRERATLYTKPEEGLHADSKAEFDPGRTSKFTLYLRPRITGFSLPALSAVAVATLLSLVSWMRASWVMVPDPLSYWPQFENSLRTMVNPRTPDLSALTTILLVAVSLLSYAAVRSGEHAYRSRLLAVPRTLVALSSVLTVLIAVLAIFQGGTRAVKDSAQISFLICLGIFVYLLFVTLQGEYYASRVALQEDIASRPIPKSRRNTDDNGSR